LWLHMRSFRELEDDPTSKDVFTTMELVSYLRYEELKSKRYLNWKSIYRSGNVEGFGFLLKPKAIGHKRFLACEQSRILSSLPNE
jgi:hypothetical protein